MILSSHRVLQALVQTGDLAEGLPLARVDKIYIGCYKFDIQKKVATSLIFRKQARKPRSYASLKLRLTHSLTGVKSRATSVAKNPGQK